jgi:hypothetical protein
LYIYQPRSIQSCIRTVFRERDNNAGQEARSFPFNCDGIGTQSYRSVTVTPGQIRKRIFGISPDEALFARRGFHAADPGVQNHLEQIGRTFIHGYCAALEENRPDHLGAILNTTELSLRGFAFEGSAMALALLDMLTPWRSGRLKAFLVGPGAEHAYMVHVGAGWAMARLHCRACLPRFAPDPFLGWLAIDGYGFHEGYFHWQRTIERQEVPHKVSGYARQVFDQGLGRSLWFVIGADHACIQNSITAFSPERHADLWSGVGLACAYAGGVDRDAVESIRCAAGRFLPAVAQGAAFAAKARQRACNPTNSTDLACEILCGMRAEEAARITDEALCDLPNNDVKDAVKPAYAIWRERLQCRLAMEMPAT